MVAVEGSGLLGMRGTPYGVVETAHLAVVEAPERGCKDAIAATDGATTCWVQTDIVDPLLRPREAEVARFCVDAMPFPGEGAHYTTDGMTAWDAARLEELLATGNYGPRRLCTFTEFQAAVAGLQSNRRFVTGDSPPNCSDSLPIGAQPHCSNSETGVHAYGAVNSHWVVADDAFIARACDTPPCSGTVPLIAGHYIVAGGTNRAQTRQAPLTPHTWHDHGHPNPSGCDDMGHDDQPIICATPDAGYGQSPLPESLAAGEERWTDLLKIARDTGRMTTFLEEGLGRAVCPATTDHPTGAAQ